MGTQLPPKWGTAPNFRPMSIVAKRLDGSRCHLKWRLPCPRRHCVRWGPAPPKGACPQFLAHVYYSQTVAHLSCCWALVKSTRMFAKCQCQRDGCPAEYRWCPLVNAAVWLTPTTRVSCSNAFKMQNPLKFAGVPQTTERSQPLVSRSSPYCKDIWRRYCCWTSFFPIVDTCLSCKDITRQSCTIVPRWRIFCDFFASFFSGPRAASFRPAS